MVAFSVTTETQLGLTWEYWKRRAQGEIETKCGHVVLGIVTLKRKGAFFLVTG